MGPMEHQYQWKPSEFNEVKTQWNSIMHDHGERSVAFDAGSSPESTWLQSLHLRPSGWKAKRSSNLTHVSL